uniref:Lipocalin/cytosolic fatty-acid binding domain-containing protein n=1 Tax=Acrobeloides nanus TaxID=290746 RepID=A0A914EE02_9BILA
MADVFAGKWVLKGAENMDAYLKQEGVGLVMRKLATSVYPTVEITITGNHWKIVTSSTVKTIVVEFDLGVEFDEVTPDGRKLKNTPTLEDGRLVEVKHGEKIKNIRVERYVEGNKLIMILNCDGVVAKRIHERVPN